MAFTGTLARSFAIAFLALFGVVAAFATIAPGGEETAPPRSLVVEALALDGHEVATVGAYVQEEQFQRGDTLSGFLGRLGVDDDAIQRLVRAPALRALRPGSNVRADITPEGAPTALSFLTGRDTLVKIVQSRLMQFGLKRRPPFQHLPPPAEASV